MATGTGRLGSAKPPRAQGGETKTAKSRTAALHDVRVLDMTWLGPGPFCSTLLGDLGAEIIKIHDPDTAKRGGLIRHMLPDSPEFPGLRNCKTIGLNLKAKAGRGILYELAKTTDVIIESFRPGVVKRLKIDYKAIEGVNPRAVYVSLSGYGQDGPYRDVAGHDINYISVGGLLGITGASGGAPVIPGVPVADFAAGGMMAAIAVLAALRARDQTGRGQFADVSMTDGIVSIMSVWINPYLTWGVVSERGETWLSGLWPWYNVYEAGDGKYLSVGALEPRFYANLCRLLGREDFAEDQFADGERRNEIFRCFRETFLTRTRDEWIEVLRREDTCVAPVYSIEELVSDDHLVARGMIGQLPHPTRDTVKQVGSALKMSDSPFQARNWCTRFGQHTDEILLGLGYDRASIDVFRRKGVIG